MVPTETLVRKDGWVLNLYHFPDFGHKEWDSEQAEDVWVPNHPWQWFLHQSERRVRDAGRAETRNEAVQAASKARARFA
jgi:hypothetical protein